VRQQVQRDEQHRSGAERDGDPLETAERPGERRGDDHHGGAGHGHPLRQPEVAGGEGDADELGDDGQRVQDEQVDDRERAPERSEAPQDQPGVADAGDRAEAQHHLLVDVQHGDQQEQRPQQPGAVVLAGLAVGGERAGVVVTDHDDQAGADDGEQRLELRRHGRAGGVVVDLDRAEGAADVADVRLIEDRGTGGSRYFNAHEVHPSPALHQSGIEAHENADQCPARTRQIMICRN
jgi:hypothetical protein